jgi:hypothetical protein
MRVGLVADGLADLALVALWPTVADLGVTMFEFGRGNWSPHRISIWTRCCVPARACRLPRPHRDPSAR